MQLPFTIAVELPTRADLRRPWFWLLVALPVLVAGTLIAARVRQPPVAAPAPGATLAVTSRPSGAIVRIDGQDRGRTAATLALPPGEHHVTLRQAGRADVTYVVRLASGQTTLLAGILWARAPAVRPVRPPLPGATLAGTEFLADGRLALTVALPASDERQVWVLDRDGNARRAGPPLARGAAVASPDGASVAYFAQASATAAPGALATDGGQGRLTELWVTDRDGEPGRRRYTLPPNTAGERLVDLDWAPDGAHLLLVSEQHPQGGGARQRLQWLDLTADPPVARDLITLPGQVVPGSYLWSPAGDRVAFLVRADGRTTLCLLVTDGRFFRALADALDGVATPSFPPIAWLPSGHGVVYAATPPDQQQSLWSGLAAPIPDLLSDDLASQGSKRLPGTGGWGPGWRDDGLVVALARPRGGGPLTLEAFDPAAGSAGQALGALPLPTDRVAGVRWDTPHGQALVAVAATTGGQPGLWLVQWTGRNEEVAP